MQSFSTFSLGSVLLVSIEEDIEDREIRRLQDQVSEQVSEGRIDGVVLDLQGLEVMDSYFAEKLAELAAMLKLLQAKVVVAGLSVPVVMTLLDFDITLPGLDFALDAEQALFHLQCRRQED
ncbi:MAG TPA: STAS domain-containing protein [Desulfobulbus sp.]|nr:STAS domain-containing protein [Desulfobulbus sp.]